MFTRQFLVPHRRARRQAPPAQALAACPGRQWCRPAGRRLEGSAVHRRYGDRRLGADVGGLVGCRSGLTQPLAWSHRLGRSPPPRTRPHPSDPMQPTRKRTARGSARPHRPPVAPAGNAAGAALMALRRCPRRCSGMPRPVMQRSRPTTDSRNIGPASTRGAAGAVRGARRDQPAARGRRGRAGAARAAGGCSAVGRRRCGPDHPSGAVFRPARDRRAAAGPPVRHRTGAGRGDGGTRGRCACAGPRRAAAFAGTVVAGGAIAIGNVLLPPLIKRDFPDRSGLMMGVYTMAVAGPPQWRPGSRCRWPTRRTWAGGARSAPGGPAAIAALAWLPRTRGHTRPPASPRARPVAAARPAGLAADDLLRPAVAVVLRGAGLAALDVPRLRRHTRRRRVPAVVLRARTDPGVARRPSLANRATHQVGYAGAAPC